MESCCELISNCIFTWGFTRVIFPLFTNTGLWIDFKLYFYVRIHKFEFRISDIRNVVNWFQIVFLREDSQVFQYQKEFPASCELISNCIFTWGFTSCFSFVIKILMLWIDFKLYFYVRIHKLRLVLCQLRRVVNWFQIVFLREDSQDRCSLLQKLACCELISNCIFTWGFTRDVGSSGALLPLWIDFKLYFYVRIHK